MDPFTLALIGTGISAVGAIQQGQAAKQTANYNAALADRNAVIATQQSAAHEEAQRKLDRRRMGAMRAGYSASGVTPDGSPLDVLGDSIAEAELNALNIRYEGQLAAQGYTESAGVSRRQGKQAEAAGYFNAGSALLTGGAKAKDLYDRANPKPTPGGSGPKYGGLIYD